MLFCCGRVRAGAIVLNLKIVVICLLLGYAASGTRGRAWAQTAVDGAISGFVVDAGGAALAGAAVQVRESSTGLILEAKSGGKGEFLVPRVPAGRYQVVVEYAQFAPLTLDGVVVEVGGVTSVEARLRVGGVATAVTVTASADAPASVSIDDAASTAVASTVTLDEIEGLPVNGRRWQSFALLTPTVNADPEGVGLLSFRGAAATQNSSRVDGGDDDQSFGAVPRGTGGDSGPEV